MDVKTFKGLNNVTDPLRLGLGWLAQADNVAITDAGEIETRQGYSLVRGGGISSAYATADYQRMYLVDDGALKTFDDVIIKIGLADATMYWAEINNQVFFNNGIDSGIIMPDNSLIEWRRGSTVNKFIGAHGEELDALLDPLPLGTSVIQFWRGRAYSAQYMPAQDQTVIWFSLPLGFHLFKLDSDYIVVPGQVTMLAPHSSALIIGTEAESYAYDGAKLDLLASYGVIPGQHWCEDEDGRILFWTARGVCSALPFTNLTERQVSVAPGVQAGGTIVRSGGQKRYVVALHQGGAAFNSF